MALSSGVVSPPALLPAHCAGHTHSQDKEEGAVHSKSAQHYL